MSEHWSSDMYPPVGVSLETKQHWKEFRTYTSTDDKNTQVYSMQEVVYKSAAVMVIPEW